MFEILKTLKESINMELLITTLIFMILGFIYFIFRLRRLISPIYQNNNYEEGSNNNNINQINESNSNQNVNNEDNNNQKLYHITIQIGTAKHNFTINLKDNIGEFVKNKIYPLTNNRNVYLFYQGQVLNQSQKFEFYEHRLMDNVVIICNIRENENGENRNNNHYNDNIEERYQAQLRNDPRSVSIYTIFTHLSILFIFFFIVFTYKNYKEIFTKQTLIMVQLIFIVWAFSLSNTITKLVYYKKISY